MIGVAQIHEAHATVRDEALGLDSPEKATEWLRGQGFNVEGLEHFAALQAASDPLACQVVSASSFLFGVTLGWQLARMELAR